MNGNSGSTDRPATRQVKCPNCGKQVAWVESEPYRPFCSRKCQLIDFGGWATERHAIPSEEPPDDLVNDGEED